MKFILCVLLTTALMLVQPACNAHHVRTEKEIQEDICMNDSFFNDYALEMESLTIEKRQTNKEDKVDYVWVNVLASNSDFSYSTNYLLTYNLYNDGWLLEDYEEGSSKITPKSYPTVSEAEAAIRSYYDNCSYVASAMNDSTAEFQFDWENTDNYLTTRYDLFLTYSFNPYDGWTGKITKKEREFYPDIVGEWLSEDQIDGPDNMYDDMYYVYEKSHHYYLNILSVEDDKITFEYNLKRVTRKFHTFNSEHYDEVLSKASSEPITAHLVCDESKHGEEYAKYYFDLDFDDAEDFLGGEEEGFLVRVAVGEGLDSEPGPYCDGYVLQRIS